MEEGRQIKINKATWIKAKEMTIKNDKERKIIRRGNRDMTRNMSLRYKMNKINKMNKM